MTVTVTHLITTKFEVPDKFKAIDCSYEEWSKLYNKDAKFVNSLEEELLHLCVEKLRQKYPNTFSEDNFADVRSAIYGINGENDTIYEF